MNGKFGYYKDENGNKLNIPSLDAGEPKNYRGSLSMVLDSLGVQGIEEIIKEIEKTEATKEESERYIKENNLPSYIDREDLYVENPEEVAPMLPWEWGAEPGWLCESYKDITIIRNPNNKKDFFNDEKADIYSTPEVLEVLKQWKEYLKKFEAEQKEKEEKKKKWKFWKK